MYNFLTTIARAIFALFFLLIGLISLSIPWSIDLRAALIQFILEEGIMISLMGIAFLAIGLALIFNAFLSLRRRCYTVKSGSTEFTVEEKVLQQYLSTYWKQRFPNYDIPVELSIRKQKIHIAIELPYHPLSEQKPLLERIKDDLSQLLATKLGYYKEFSLAAVFQAPPKSLPVQTD